MLCVFVRIEPAELPFLLGQSKHIILKVHTAKKLGNIIFFPPERAKNLVYTEIK